ncbi:MAG: GGDEF domain-containing protein [Gammaproteobacteria bacterium]
MKLSRLRAISRELDEDIGRAELRDLARNVSDGAWLLLLLTGLYLLTPGSDLLRPELVGVAVVLFAVFSLALRFLPRFRRETRLKISLQLSAMVAFITAFLLAVTTHPGLLLVLYLLPVIMAALTLGRWPTFAVTVFSVLGFLAAAILREPGLSPTGRYIVELGMALAPFLLVTYVTAMLADEINMAKQRIRTLSETDHLTGLANLRAFSRLHRQEHERAIRHHRVYSIVVMDLNGLKQVNDTHGHEAGDRAIILLANVIARLIRSTDAAARLGGDEFVLLLSENDAEQARQVTNRICAALERCTIEVGSHLVRLSVSAGAATFPRDAQDAREMIAVADQAMYRQKHAVPPAGAKTGTPEAEVV